MSSSIFLVPNVEEDYFELGLSFLSSWSSRLEAILVIVFGLKCTLNIPLPVPLLAREKFKQFMKMDSQ